MFVDGLSWVSLNSDTLQLKAWPPPLLWGPFQHEKPGTSSPEPPARTLNLLQPRDTGRALWSDSGVMETPASMGQGKSLPSQNLWFLIYKMKMVNVFQNAQELGVPQTVYLRDLSVSHQ